MTNNTVKNIKMPDGQVLNIGGADTVPLFTGMYFDFKPNNFSWLKSGEQANSGGIYTTAYNTLVNCLTEENNIYDLKVIEESEMISGVDYSEYWKVNQDEMYFVTPTKLSYGMLNPQINTVPVIGNGLALGLTDGTSNATLIAGFGGSATNNTYGLSSSISNYTQDLQTLPFNSSGGSGNSFSNRGLGITTNPLKSGIVADLSNAKSSTAQLYFKVANAVENLELLDAGEVLETLADKIGHQECKAYITETYRNSEGSSWYRVYSDGWIEQGGIIEELSDGWTITFLKPFTTTNYMLQGEQWGMDATGNLGITKQNTTNAAGNHVGSSTMKVSWYACGY